MKEHDFKLMGWRQKSEIILKLFKGDKLSMRDIANKLKINDPVIVYDALVSMVKKNKIKKIPFKIGRAERVVYEVN